MNRTIDPIPPAVEEAIANREFALAEGTTSQEPAIVGREISGYGETWSVVAVVTRGRDDRGRGVSLYRYFLCRAEAGIEAILRWWNKSQVFNPFDTKTIGQSHRVSFTPAQVPIKEELRRMLGNRPPIVIPASQPCMPLLLNQMTQELPTIGKRSWAYKVAALERPEYFQIIYPADPRGSAVFKQALSQRPRQSAVVSGEQSLKTAISAVMNGRVKAKHIAALENALNHPQIDEKYWQSLFNNQGATEALTQNIYGTNQIRLLSLKAMLLPGFLPDFLKWLYKTKKSEGYYIASCEFQQAILQQVPNFTQDCPNLTEQIKQGICIVMDRLVKQQPILAEATLLLGGSYPGIWREAYDSSLRSEMETDITMLPDCIGCREGVSFQATKYPEWNQLLGDIMQFWQVPTTSRNSNYLPLAKLFESMGRLKMAAIFYQIAQGNVPKPIFETISGPHRWECRVFGLAIASQKDLSDCVYIPWLKSVELVEFYMPKILIVAMLFGAFGLGWFSHPLLTNTSSKEDNQESTAPATTTPSPSPTKNDCKFDEYNVDEEIKCTRSYQEISNIKDELSEDLKEQLNNQSNPSQKVEILKAIINKKTGAQELPLKYLTINADDTEKIVLFYIRKTLDLPTTIEGGVTNEEWYNNIRKNESTWREFREAIKKYTQNKKGEATEHPAESGEIDEDTAKQLESDIRKDLGLSKSESPSNSTPTN